jgi:hypothetical protein
VCQLCVVYIYLALSGADGLVASKLSWHAHVDASICQLCNICPASAVTGCTFTHRVFKDL